MNTLQTDRLALIVTAESHRRDAILDQSEM
jgi:hypothetical protein